MHSKSILENKKISFLLIAKGVETAFNLAGVNLETSRNISVEVGIFPLFSFLSATEPNSCSGTASIGR